MIRGSPFRAITKGLCEREQTVPPPPPGHCCYHLVLSVWMMLGGASAGLHLIWTRLREVEENKKCTFAAEAEQLWLKFFICSSVSED